MDVAACCRKDDGRFAASFNDLIHDQMGSRRCTILSIRLLYICPVIRFDMELPIQNSADIGDETMSYNSEEQQQARQGSVTPSSNRK